MQDEIGWYTYREGMDTAKVEDKPVFIDFWAKWCGPCMDMEENVYPDRDVVEKSEDITFVKVNVDKQGDIASSYGVQPYTDFGVPNSRGRRDH